MPLNAPGLGGGFAAPPIATLRPRQRRLYQSTCDIWRAVRVINAEGVAGDDQWTRISVGNPCYYQYAQNDDSNEGVGRIDRRTMLTEDRIHLVISVDLKAADMLVDTTVGAETNGIVHRAMGGPRRIRTAPGRGCNLLAVQMMKEDHPPATILAAY